MMDPGFQSVNFGNSVLKSTLAVFIGFGCYCSVECEDMFSCLAFVAAVPVAFGSSRTTTLYNPKARESSESLASVGPRNAKRSLLNVIYSN